MARRRRNKDAIIDGLIGAGIGAMNFKLSEAARQRAEQAEMEKEQRLAAIRAGEMERAAQIQTARDQAAFANQSALTDKQLAAQAERDAAQQQHAMSLAEKQMANQREITRMQGGNSIAAAQASRGPGDTRLFQDQDGRQYEIPSGDSTRLEQLQASGKRLQLVEGSRGGRYMDLGGGGGPLMSGGAGTPGGNGAASPAAPAPNFVWDAKAQRLVPAR